MSDRSHASRRNRTYRRDHIGYKFAPPNRRLQPTPERVRRFRVPLLALGAAEPQR
jgi:hypothetical protein